MREFFDEVVTVVAYSRKTQVALVLGPVSFFIIKLLEARFVGGLELTGKWHRSRRNFLEQSFR